MGSKSFTPKEFLAELGKGEVVGPLTLSGMVKTSDDSSELLFVAGTRCGNWTSLPLDIIDSVEVLGSAPCDDHAHQLVTLTFKKPKSPEGAAYAALLSAAANQPGKRVVRKKSGSPAQGAVATFSGGCGCSDYEIDINGHMYELYSVTEFDDGSCICDYK